MASSADRLHRAGLVVGEQHAHQGRIARRVTVSAEQRFQRRRLNYATAIDRQRIEPPAEFHEMLGGFENASMFDGGNDDSWGRFPTCRQLGGRLAICPTLAIRQPKNGQIIRLGPTAGEYEPIRLVAVQVGPQDFGHALPRLFQHPPCPLARLVLARRVGVPFRVAVRHRLDNLRAGRRSRVVIEKNVLHHGIMGLEVGGGNGPIGARFGRTPVSGPRRPTLDMRITALTLMYELSEGFRVEIGALSCVFLPEGQSHVFCKTVPSHVSMSWRGGRGPKRQRLARPDPPPMEVQEG